MIIHKQNLFAILLCHASRYQIKAVLIYKVHHKKKNVGIHFCSSAN